MELNLNPQDQAFRDEPRVFIPESLPAEIENKVEMSLGLGQNDYVAWQKIVGKYG